MQVENHKAALLHDHFLPHRPYEQLFKPGDSAILWPI